MRFIVEGERSPDLPLRVLNLFAQRALAVDAAEVTSTLERFRITVDIGGLNADQAGILVEKMRALVLVTGASVHPDRSPSYPPAQ